MENKETQDIRLKSAAQDVLITKILKSKKILDKEYRMFRSILDNQVISTYDAAVFIEHVLALLKFRRTFFNGKHKAYKTCVYCHSRDHVKRYDNLRTGKRIWLCDTCELNLSKHYIIRVKFDEEKEASADLYRKYDYSAEQEIQDEESRHPIEE